MDRELEEVNKEIEDNLDNVEDESFILSQKENAIMIPLMLGGFLIFTLYMILPLFNINLFLIHFILFVILLFFVCFAIKIYPTPDEINDKLLNQLDLYQYKYILNSFEIPATYISKSIRFNGRRFLITKIGDRAFKDCTNFKYIKIPNSIKNIGREAFSGCTGLTTLKVPDSVTVIKPNAFLGVKNVIYNGSAFGAPWGAENINGKEILSLVKEATNRQQYYIQKYLLKTDFIDSKKEKFSNIVFFIGFFIFIVAFVLFYMSSLSVVEKNKMCMEIGIPILVLIITSIPSMIYYCVYKNELNDYTLKQIIKKNKFKINSLDIPEIYDSFMPIIQQFNSLNKKFFITSIKKMLFKNCINLKEVKIPDSVCKIGEEAFSGCTGIDNIKIPDYVIEVGKNAFLGVNNVIYNGTDPNAPWGAKALNGKYL